MCREVHTTYWGYVLKKLLVVSGLFSALCLFSACANIPMKVDSVSNPYLQSAEYKRFSFTPAHAADQQKEQHLMDVVKKGMGEKGFVFDDKDPQFLIDITFGEESKQVDKGYVDVTNKVALVFIDVMYRKQTTDAKLVWQGEARSSSGNRDVSAIDVEKCLAIGLLQSYPNTLKSSAKDVSASSCKK